MTRRPGRPLQGAERLSANIASAITPAERDAVLAAAHEAGLTVSQWVRLTFRRADSTATDPPASPGFSPTC